MEGISINEISQRLAISATAVKMRLYQRDIKPIGYIGPVGLYREEDIDKIRDLLPRGKKSPKYGQKGMYHTETAAGD